MGSVIENAKTKEKCQIFTPDDIVETMLDHVGYIDSLYGKTILENSCGNGQFLKGIVKRYINDCKRKGLSRTKIKNGLGRDIFGIELDPSLYRECIQTLNSITDSFGLKRVCWQIKQADALREPYSLTFDFVVGNPPYVSYWDLEKSEREYIEGKYTTCQYGAWDYSYAFLQDGFNHLNSAGKMAYIIPNSIFKTKSGRSIRTLLQPYLTEVLDFTTTNVFEKVLTSPAIIIIDRSTRTEQIVYKDLSANLESTVNRETLNDEWLFGCQEQAPGLQHKFGDYFRVATSIATQCNSVYVLTNYSDDGEYLICEGSKIEKSVVRKAASPKGKANDTTEYNKVRAHFDGKKVTATVFRNEFDLNIIPKELFRQPAFSLEPYRLEDFSKEYFEITRTISELTGNDSSAYANMCESVGPFDFQFVFMKLSNRGEGPYYYKAVSRKRKIWMENHGGLKIYRDNFLVRPYGDPTSKSFDWLGLDARKGVNPVAISDKSEQWHVNNSQLQGTVLISRVYNASILDKSSREGIIENEFFDTLSSLLIAIISIFEKDRAHIVKNIKQYNDQQS